MKKLIKSKSIPLLIIFLSLLLTIGNTFSYWGESKLQINDVLQTVHTGEWDPNIGYVKYPDDFSYSNPAGNYDFRLHIKNIKDKYVTKLNYNLVVMKSGNNYYGVYLQGKTWGNIINLKRNGPCELVGNPNNVEKKCKDNIPDPIKPQKLFSFAYVPLNINYNESLYYPPGFNTFYNGSYYFSYFYGSDNGKPGSNNGPWTKITESYIPGKDYNAYNNTIIASSNPNDYGSRIVEVIDGKSYLYIAQRNGQLSKPGSPEAIANGDWNLFTYDYVDFNTYYPEDIVLFEGKYYVYINNGPSMGIKPAKNRRNTHWRPAGTPFMKDDPDEVK